MITLSEEGCLNNNVSLEEALFLLVIYKRVNIKVVEDLLLNKGFIDYNREPHNSNVWRISGKGKDLMESVIMDSDKQQEPQDRLILLATKLKEIFPKGKKEGTNYYWTEGVALIVRRLKMFFKKYGNSYTDEQIIQATKKYIESFNGDYQYMRLLKYFIFKEKLGAGGEVEGDSELISYIENYGQEDVYNDNWVIDMK